MRRPPSGGVAARGGTARHLACAVVAEVGGLCAAPRVGERHPQRRALAFADFSFAIVTYENRLPGQNVLLIPSNIWRFFRACSCGS
jgi:hypothetical protein